MIGGHPASLQRCELDLPQHRGALPGRRRVHWHESRRFLSSAPPQNVNLGGAVMQPVLSGILAVVVMLSPVSSALAQPLPEPAPVQPVPFEQPDRSKRKYKRPSSNLPAPDVAQQMLHFSRDAFTDDAWDGMQGWVTLSWICFLHQLTQYAFDLSQP